MLNRYSCYYWLCTQIWDVQFQLTKEESWRIFCRTTNLQTPCNEGDNLTICKLLTQDKPLTLIQGMKSDSCSPTKDHNAGVSLVNNLFEMIPRMYISVFKIMQSIFVLYSGFLLNFSLFFFLMLWIFKWHPFSLLNGLYFSLCLSYRWRIASFGVQLCAMCNYRLMNVTPNCFKMQPVKKRLRTSSDDDSLPIIYHFVFHPLFILYICT